MYDCIIVGGGIAGLQAAIQLGRYEHQVLVLDRADGRSTLCRSYHNILGFPDGVGGETLREYGRRQALALGVKIHCCDVVKIERHGDDRFLVRDSSGEVFESRRLLLATGVRDRLPDVPGLVPCLGLSIYVCPDCDGYEIKGKRTVVLGAGKVGAEMAHTLLFWNPELIYVDGGATLLPDEAREQLESIGVRYIHQEVKEIEQTQGMVQRVYLENGDSMEAERGFIAFGGNQVYSQFAKDLGAKVLDNKHIEVNPRTKETTVRHLYAAGDVVAHSEQVTIAMGDGSQAAIWIHKSLLKETSRTV